MPYTPQRKQQTRERIVRSARRLFNRKGFAEVTIDEIMTEAGLTRGGFYRHFTTKSLSGNIMLDCRAFAA
jgi:TetR/AcrR family transcriptional regulator, transcriptional repressor for nem operon